MLQQVGRRELRAFPHVIVQNVIATVLRQNNRLPAEGKQFSAVGQFRVLVAAHAKVASLHASLRLAHPVV